MKNLLGKLGIESITPGGFCGEWIGSGEALESVSPIDGKPIAVVTQITSEEYDRIATRAQEAFLKWRSVPAPVRGETIRLLGNELREHKEDLGALLTWARGKLRPEGAGGVQEMSAICDFAV